MSNDVLECDLLVIGAGMAGLSAAGWAASRGATVIVIEKAEKIGGSAFLSGGMLWTATSQERMNAYGGGDAALGKVVFDMYPTAIAWLRERGIALSEKMNALHGYGYQIDIIKHLQGCATLVEQAGGHVIFGTDTETLLHDASGAVIGATTRHADGCVDVHARATLLATGGFQGSPELRARYIHPNARDMLLRSNPVSQGDGIRLGAGVGGAVPGTNPGFYGHLVTASKHWGQERYYTMLSQYHSDHTLLLNEDGLRFCDETLGDHTNTYQTVLQKNARALCFWDATVHADHATQAIVKFAPPMDKFEVAMEHGGAGIRAGSVAEIAAFAGRHGFNEKQVAESIADFNAHCRHGWETLAPSRSHDCTPLDTPPFYALIVHPAITFTYGGLTIDTGARVLRADGTPVPGLYAAGSDAGAAYGTGYAGGLALAMTFGLTAAMSAGWQ
jgi:succinate dehydrogenase/fumarate reductase flavoprotein subunit